MLCLVLKFAKKDHPIFLLLLICGCTLVPQVRENFGHGQNWLPRACLFLIRMFSQGFYFFILPGIF